MKTVELAPEEAKAVIAAHNRYLIYELMGKHVVYKARRAVSGVVCKVYRNIFDNRIEFQMANGRTHMVDEPVAIVMEDDALVFYYGDLEPFDYSDETLFEEARQSGFAGDTVADVIRRTTPRKVRKVSFVLGKALGDAGGTKGKVKK